MKLFDGDLQVFLDRCAESGDAAYRAFEQLVFKSADPGQRVYVVKLLHRLVETILPLGHKTAIERYHLSIEEKVLEYSLSDSIVLTLLHFPSTFIPEEWSMTFFEGLSRYPNDEFSGMIVGELGCGNGWITIALALRYPLRRIYGLDINPRAILAARINLLLNGFGPGGEILPDQYGIPLFQKIEFACSDLLAHCRDNGILLDRILGCIPQVLNPDPHVTRTIVPENASDRELYDLANYCGKQGMVEDQFGLGLVARAIEESIDSLIPSGKIILNLGGRPGHAVLARMFSRRGFNYRRIWSRRIHQAEDTDIHSLVEIERQTPHRFEFYHGVHANASISAGTAGKIIENGGTILHSISVFEASCRNFNQNRKVLGVLNDPLYINAKQGLDLSFDDEEQRSEKLDFLARICDELNMVGSFGYGPTAGLNSFREKLARFFRAYHSAPFGIENFFIAPGRLAIIANLIEAYQPRTILVDNLYARPLCVLIEVADERDDAAGSRIFEVPSSLRIASELIPRLKPEIAILKPGPDEHQSPEVFTKLIEITRSYAVRTIIDISDFMELTSSPKPLALITCCADNPFPGHVSILCGLVKNRVYVDLKLSFLISTDVNLLRQLECLAELTYSRVSTISQIYYEELIHNLVKFHLAPQSSGGPDISPVKSAKCPPFIEPCPQFLLASTHPALGVATERPSGPTVRLDYGENSLPAPSCCKAALMESFTRQHLTTDEASPEPELGELLRQRLGIERNIDDDYILANGIAPFFDAALHHVRNIRGTMIFPTGSYGYFIAACQHLGVPAVFLHGEESTGFAIDPDELSRVMKTTANPVVYLNLPVVNPTGKCYSAEAIMKLISIIDKTGGTFLLDTVFDGLVHSGRSVPPKLDEVFKNRDFRGIILGGWSKEFAAGGLRFGYAYTRNALLGENLRKFVLYTPHLTLCRAVKTVYRHLLDLDPTLIDELDRQRSKLAIRAEKLCAMLMKTGWTVIKPEGGLFLVAKPRAYYGKKLAYQDKGKKTTVQLDDLNIARTLHQQTGLLINDPIWTGIPGYHRFVLSVKDADFEAALQALAGFKQLVVS